jgi:PAS domain S-box-containing protein
MSGHTSIRFDIAQAATSSWLTRHNLFVVLAAALAIFTAGRALPPYPMLSAGYVLPVLLSLWSRRPGDLVLSAAIASALVMLEGLLTPVWGGAFAFIVNRLLLVGVIWFVVVSCISRRRNMHERQAWALHGSEERFRLATDALNGFVFERDLVSGATIRSGRLLEQFGLNPLTGTGTDGSDLLALVHPDDRERVLEYFRSVDSNGYAHGIEYRLRDAQNAFRFVLSRRLVITSSSGQPQRVVGCVVDVSEQHHLEQARRLAEERLARAVRGTRDGPWEYEVATDAYWLTPFFMELIGYEHGELPPTREVMAGLIHPDDIEMQQQAFKRHLAGAGPYDVEFRVRTKTGDYRWFRSRGTCERSPDGSPLRMSGALQDVTERRQYQEALIEATETAAAASRAKSAFLANMSHEIRTPMNGVIGMTELLLETQLDATQRDYTETIRDSATALLTVINDILDFSKIEAGKLDLETIDMDLRDTAEDVGRLLALQAHAKGLELTADIDPAVPDLVQGDPGRLRQILVNLGSNAVKFTERGEVAIDVRVVESSATGTVIRCSVRDTGPGIPKEQLDKLFLPFAQLDASTTRRFGGTGLGLSIVRRLVELMHGDTGVESEIGVGSTFWFTARFGIAARRHIDLDAQERGFEGRHVLVVDDNATNRRVLSGQLAICGLNPVVAANAEQAMRELIDAAVAHQPFDVALLDFHMPECDGAELATRINADARLKSTRLVLLTSAGHRGDAQRFAELGFAAYLLKPITQRELVGCLSLVLSNSAAAWQLHTQPLVTRHHVRALRIDGATRILLAEDNLVNQKVARATLEKLGFEVEVASDGIQAVNAWKSGRFDLILMDCQMPNLDGYSATREIRRLETGERRTPIIALTAHAMKGDDAKCRAAGMDDYLTKPLDRLKLLAALELHLHDDLKRSRCAPKRTRDAIPMTTNTPVDWSALLEATDNDAQMTRELVELFVASGDQALAAIAAAVASGDHKTIKDHAHAIKGASANMYAGATNAAAGRLEEAARVGQKDDLRRLAQELRAEVSRAIDYMRIKVAG